MACNPDRYEARSYPRMRPKAKIEFTVSFLYSRVTQNTKIICTHKFNLNERVFLNANSKLQSITQGKNINK